MSRGHIPSRLRAAGHTWPGATQGFPAGLCMTSRANVPACQRAAAQDRTVYKAASHVLPHASPVTVLGGRYSYQTDGGRGGGMLRPREVKELCPSHTAKDPQGWDHTASEQSDRCGFKLSLPLYRLVVWGGFGWVSPAGAVCSLGPPDSSHPSPQEQFLRGTAHFFLNKPREVASL